MPNSADRKKYEPLREYLEALPPTANERALSFDQVAQIIGDTLPPSATTYREWWSNQEAGSRAPHWRAAGFKVDHADLKRKIVRFKRITPAKERSRALTLGEVVMAVNERAQGRQFGGLSAPLYALGCGTPILPITFDSIVGNAEHFQVVGRASATLAPCGNVVRVHFVELIDSALVRVVPHCAERAVGFAVRLCRAPFASRRLSA